MGLQAYKEPFRAREVVMVCIKSLLSLPSLPGPLRESLNKLFVKRQAVEGNDSVRSILSMPEEQLKSYLHVTVLGKLSKASNLPDKNIASILFLGDSAEGGDKELWQEHSQAASNGTRCLTFDQSCCR